MRRAIFVFPIIALVVLAIISQSVRAQGTGNLEVHFFDVDQGDAILLKGPNFTILVDAGRHDRNDVVPQLRAAGVGTIDLFVGTHPHADHIGQAPDVLEAFAVTDVWMSGDTQTTVTFERTLDAILAEGANYHEPRAGEVLEIGSARIEVLNPVNLDHENPNEDSVVFRLIFGTVAFMFTGDAELEAELGMVNSGRSLQAQILKLGHHGSNTSSSAAFLSAVNPDVAIWSAGEDNPYGHPHQATLDRLNQLGIEVHGTATEGTIIVCTDGVTYRFGACEVPQFSFRLLLPGLALAPADAPGATSTATFQPTPTATREGEATATATRTPTVTPTPTEVTGAVCDCSGNIYNCPNFATQPQAQACFDYCVDQGVGDIHGLDNDNDGIACENLPPGFRVVR